MITDLEIRSKPTQIDQWFTDPAPRGYGRFVARISPSGERSFYFRHSTRTGKRDVLRIGAYSQKEKVGYFTLDEARKEALKWSQLYQEGILDLRAHFAKLEADRLQAIDDAREQIEREKHAAQFALDQANLEKQRRLTVRQMFEQWCQAELKPHLVAGSKQMGRTDGGQYVRRQFECHLFPPLGDVAIADVTKADILAILDIIKGRENWRTANVLLANAKQMFAFAAEREVIAFSPIALIKKSKIGGRDVKRTRNLSRAELAELVTKLPSAKLNPRTLHALWLDLATGCRIGELMGAVWGPYSRSMDEELQVIVDKHNLTEESGTIHVGFVDLSARTYYLSKTKNGRDHLIHLSDFAILHFQELAMLREAHRVTGEAVPWVFPNSRCTGPVSVKAFGKQLLDRQRGNKTALKNRTKAVNALTLPGGNWTAHDLRRTAATLMSTLGVGKDAINECINHVDPGYNQDRRLPEQMIAFDKLGTLLAAL
ncbi:MAG: integrase family protein [Burkholderiaceae bacterium]|nr:integrase family protein [Burkholderiaceae bacterium]